MRLLSLLFVALVLTTGAFADQRCRRNYVAGASGLEVNGTSCDRGQNVAGVKAVCRDGWQSFHTGAGTCSHHGGIAKRVN